MTRILNFGEDGKYISSFNRLVVPSVRLSTFGSRTFAVAGPTVYNRPPDVLTSARLLGTFCKPVYNCTFAYFLYVHMCFLYCVAFFC